MKKLFLLCVASTLLVALNACSAGSASSNQTVSAQTTYSNSSLSGTYSVTLVDVYMLQQEVVVPADNGNNTAEGYTGVGTIQLNGSGTITGGTLNLYIINPSLYSPNTPVPCPFSVTGTYSVQSTALGTATLNLSSSIPGCVTSETWKLAFAAADSGDAIQFVRTDGDQTSGSAIKQ
jgi:hypothetical protein